MHDWCPVSHFCTRCGLGRGEFANWDAPCFPTPAGAVFTIKAQRAYEAFYGQLEREMERLAREGRV